MAESKPHRPHDAGERTAEFVRLLSQCDRQLFAFVLSLVCDLAETEEILQETKLRLWEQFDQYQPDKDFGAWAVTIAKYQVMTFRNKRRDSPMCFSQDFLDVVGKLVDKAPEKFNVRQAALQECLQKLTKDQSELVKQCYGDDVSLKRVAAELGRSVTSLYQSLWRCRKMLFKCVQRKLHAEELQ